MSIFDLGRPYDKVNFVNYLNDILFPDFLLEERPIELDSGSIFVQMNYLGSSTVGNVSIFEAVCDERDSGKRITITQHAFRVLRQHGISNALVAFTYGSTQWRLSLLTSKLEYENNKLIIKQNNPRRYSYLLGVNTKIHTPHRYLIERGRIASLEELMQRFSVEVVNKQFYDEIAMHFTELVGGERNGSSFNGALTITSVTKPSIRYQEFGVRIIGRIMFCWFLKEKKSVSGVPLISEQLLSYGAVTENPDYYHTVMEPLFFELLNTRQKRRKEKFKEGLFAQIPYLNGGLFCPQESDYYRNPFDINNGTRQVTIPDEWFKSLFSVLERYNFTVDENTSFDVELSIDPEMLGRIFENLLAEINPETGESAKKSTGSFYTPRDIVGFMVDTSLFHYLKSRTKISESRLNAIISYTKEDDLGYPLDETEKTEIVDALSSLTIIDPACGSGAFPMGILQKIVYILQQADPNAKLWARKQYSSVTSVELRQEIKHKEERGMFDYIRKLGIIRESIFGVDIQTIATEIAKLRCFLSLVVEEIVEDDEPNRGIQPLPNLDFKFITANSLVRLDDDPNEQIGQISIFEDQSHIKELKRIRDEFFTADSEERSELKSEFKDIQRIMFRTTISNYAKIASHRYQLLSEWNPFENESTTWFDPEWMFGIENFDLVIANPPYIHLEHIKELSKFYKSLNYTTYEARGDIYSLFYEKGVQLLKEDGFLCYITSNKWMRAAYGKSLRDFFANSTNPIQLIDFAGQQIFDATVDTNILLLSRSSNQEITNAVSVKDQNCISNLSDYIKQNSVNIAFTTSDSWTILSPIEQSIKAKIDAIGRPLKDWDVKINYGIKTGCNEAFIINGAKREELIDKDPKSAEIIRPILRGRDIKRYQHEWAGLYLIALFPSLEYNIDDFPAVRDYLLSADWSHEIPKGYGHKKLEQTGNKYCIEGNHFTARKSTKNKWFETQDPIGYWDDFSKQKIVWGNLALSASFTIVEDAFFVNAPSPMIVPGEKYLLAILNSKLADFYIRNLGVTRSGGYFEYKPMFVQEFPALRTHGKSREQLENLVTSIMNTHDMELRHRLEYEIDSTVYRLYGLTADEINFIANNM